MTEQKDSHGHQPDVQPKEPQDRREHGERASELISHFETAIDNTPEFAKALKNHYFEKPDEFEFDTHVELQDYEFGLGRVLVFKKGDDMYQVKYSKGRSTREVTMTDMEYQKRYNIERLQIVKTYPSTETEYLFLTVYTDKSGSIHDGKTDLTKYDSNGDIDNTSTTVQSAKDFLTTNFGQPQPPQK